MTPLEGRCGFTSGVRSVGRLVGDAGGPVWSKGERSVELVELPEFGRPMRLVWHNRRWR